MPLANWNKFIDTSYTLEFRVQSNRNMTNVMIEIARVSLDEARDNDDDATLSRGDAHQGSSGCQNRRIRVSLERSTKHRV